MGGLTPGPTDLFFAGTFLNLYLFKHPLPQPLAPSARGAFRTANLVASLRLRCYRRTAVTGWVRQGQRQRLWWMKKCWRGATGGRSRQRWHTDFSEVAATAGVGRGVNPRWQRYPRSHAVGATQPNVAVQRLLSPTGRGAGGVGVQKRRQSKPQDTPACACARNIFGVRPNCCLKLRMK